MKTKAPLLIAFIACWQLIVSVNAAPPTTFTYQGRLNDADQSANGSFDIRAILYTADVGGSQVGPIDLLPAVMVADGVFTAELDFGVGAFNGEPRWVELAVRKTGAGGFTRLDPRQAIMPAPFAQFALTPAGPKGDKGDPGAAGAQGPKGDTGATGTQGPAGPKGDTGLTGAQGPIGLTGLQGPKGDTGLTGATGAQGPKGDKGDTGAQGVQGPKGDTGAIGTQGPAGPKGDTGLTGAQGPIGLTGLQGPKGDTGLIGATGAQGPKGDKGATGAQGVQGLKGDTGAMGVQGIQGIQGLPGPPGSADAWSRTGNAGTLAGTHFLGTTDNQPLEFRVNGQRALRLQPNANAAPNLIGGSLANTIDSITTGATIAGGDKNSVQSLPGAESDHAAIGGGEGNQISNGLHATIAGGGANVINANSGTIGGGTSNTIETNAYDAVIGGGHGNIIHTNASGATIAGGVINELLLGASFSFIGGGTQNKGGSNAFHATITGGSNNTIDHDTSYGFIGGGKLHNIMPQSAHAVIAGGDGNTAAGEAPAIGGGTLNVIESGTTYSVIAGGGGNRVAASSFAATVAGGYLNQVAANLSLAAGNRAQANHPGTFVWAGGNTVPYATIFPNSVNLYAANGVSMDYGAQSAAQPRGARYVYIGPFNAGNTISTWNGARLTDGGVWSNASDRNRKTDFKAVDAARVLEKVIALPVRQWRYTNEDAGVKHLGPVAQDFRSAFGLGTDDKSIGTVDADGVALAAIQGLNAKVEERRAQLEDQLAAQEAASRSKDIRIAALEQSVAELKQLVGALASERRGAR